MLLFNIVAGGKTVKTLRARSMEAILDKYVKHCKSQGFTTCVYATTSFGNSAWQNSRGELMLLTVQY